MDFTHQMTIALGEAIPAYGCLEKEVVPMRVSKRKWQSALDETNSFAICPAQMITMMQFKARMATWKSRYHKVKQTRVQSGAGSFKASFRYYSMCHELFGKSDA